MLERLGMTVTLHHFTRNQGNPADAGCNEAMNENANVIDRVKTYTRGCFASLDSTEDEPNFKKVKKIPRLYQLVLDRGDENATHAAPNTLLENLSMEDVLCRVPTFWKTDANAVGLLAGCLTRTLIGIRSTDPRVSLDAWRRFFLLPQSKLRKVKGVPGNRANVRSALADHKPPEPACQEQALKAAKDFEERQLNRATALATNKLFGKAARQLERANIPLPPNAHQLLQDLHPRSNWTPSSAPMDPAFITIDHDVLLRIMKEQSSLKSPGPSSWTEDQPAHSQMSASPWLARWRGTSATVLFFFDRPSASAV